MIKNKIKTINDIFKKLDSGYNIKLSVFINDTYELSKIYKYLLPQFDHISTLKNRYIITFKDIEKTIYENNEFLGQIFIENSKQFDDVYKYINIMSIKEIYFFKNNNE